MGWLRASVHAMWLGSRALQHRAAVHAEGGSLSAVWLRWDGLVLQWFVLPVIKHVLIQPWL